MTEDTAIHQRKSGRLNLRVSNEEYERFQKVKAAVQRRVGPNIKATDKGTFLEALSMLEAYYERLERDRQRSR